MRSWLLGSVSEVRRWVVEVVDALVTDDEERCKQAWAMLTGTVDELERRVRRIGYPKGRIRKVTPELVEEVKRWKGSKTEIASRLGISRQTVYAILRKA